MNQQKRRQLPGTPRLLQRRTGLEASSAVSRLVSTEDELLVALATKTNGMIFEFKEMAQAEAFAAAVKSRFHLDGRVFDDAEAAGRAHMFPWVQYPPVVHIDRPWWELDPDT